MRNSAMRILIDLDRYLIYQLRIAIFQNEGQSKWHRKAG
jgi:hypothetical protein